MKISIFKQLAILLITLNIYLHAEDTAYLSNIDNFTLKEVKEYLSNDQKSIDAFIKLSENNNLNFTLSITETTTPSFNSNPYKILNINASRAKIDKLLSDMYIRQYIVYPKSSMLIHLDSYKMEDVFGAERSSKDFPRISLHNINYIDKKKKKVNLKAKWESYNDLYVDVNTSKPIESIGSNISYTLPLIKEYYISKKSPIVLKDGIIKLENIADGQVQLSMSSDTLKEHIIVVDAIHKSGKSLRKSGESMYSHPSKKNLAYMKKTNILLKELIDRIDNKSIFDSLFGKKNIESIKALKEALKNIPKPTEEEQKQKSFWTYSFSGDIAKVKVVIGEGRTETYNKELVIKKHPSMHKNSLGYYEAKNTQTRKKGLVGKDGKWLIQPKYHNLSYLNDYYYYGEKYKDEPRQLYRLNTKKNTLEHVKYLLYREKLIDGNLQMTEKIRNDQRGVVNAKTGQIIVPMKYYNVVFDKGLFVAHFTQNKKYYIEIFNKKGKRLHLKSSKYNRVKVFDVDCMIATRDGKNQYNDKIDILNKSGKVFSKGKWNAYHGTFGKNRLLLVENWRRISKKEKNTCDWSGYEEESYCQDKVAFVNPKGKRILNVSKYMAVKEFSNGLAAVRDKKTERWGYINTKGKLVIPYEYKDANYFQEKYAYVRKGDNAFLIDKMNNIHVRLPDTSMGMTISSDSNTAEYHLYNGETYDANGTLIQKKTK